MSARLCFLTLDTTDYLSRSTGHLGGLLVRRNLSSRCSVFASLSFLLVGLFEASLTELLCSFALPSYCPPPGVWFRFYRLPSSGSYCTDISHVDLISRPRNGSSVTVLSVFPFFDDQGCSSPPIHQPVLSHSFRLSSAQVTPRINDDPVVSFEPFLFPPLIFSDLPLFF